jgi:hypothetical protein
MSVLAICLYVVAGLETVSCLSYVNLVGKTRTYTGPVVSVLLVLTAFAVVVIVLAALKVGS